MTEPAPGTARAGTSSPLERALADLRARVGQEIFAGDWLTVDQERIDRFAEATGDHQWIHTDPERAASTPFGATIAHGFLTLSLIPALERMGDTTLRDYEGVRMRINYGLDRVRFPAPVRAGARVRSRAAVRSVEVVSPSVLQVVYLSTVELEGSEKPACVAERVVRLVFD